MTTSLRQVDVTVVGGRAVATPLDELSNATAPTLSVTTVPVDGLSPHLAETDCLVVDRQAVEKSWYTVVDDVTDKQPQLPIVVLVDEEFGATVAAALRADAAEHLPRSLCQDQPTLVASRLASLVARTDEREFEQMYRQLFERVSDGLVVHEPETGEIRDCNDRFCEMTGYSHTELVGETIDRITAPDAEYSYERAREHIERAQTEGPQLFEWHNQRRDGATFYSEVHLDVMRIYGDEYVLASVRDITERKRREREFEQIFHGVQDGILVFDPETLEILQANDAYLDILAYESVDALREQGIDGLSVTSEGFTFEAGQDIHQRVAETGEPEIVEWQAETRTGDKRFLEVKVAPAVIGGEAVTVAIQRDITARKRRERDFEQIFHGVNDVIAAHHPETGELVTVNDTLLEITGYDRETIFERGAQGLTVPTEEFRPEQVSQRIDRVMAGEDVGPYEQAIETADGGVRWLEVNPTRAVIDGEPRFLAIGRDVTARRERQQRLEIERGRRSALFEDNPDPVLGLEFVDREPVIREVNPAFERVFGFDADSVVGSTVGETLVPDGEREQYERFRERVADGETIERAASRQTAKGRREFVFKVIQLDTAEAAATDAYVWYTDVTERRRRERAIKSLQDGTARMQRADTAEEIAEIACESARKALDLPDTVCWLHDGRSDRLEPAATTGDSGEIESLTPLTPDDWGYDIFEAGEVVQPPGGDAEPTVPVDDPLLLPLGDHGLLAAGRPDGPTDDDVTLDVARTLAEQIATALSRVERAQAVRRNERRLQAIIDRIDEGIFLAPLSELTEGTPAPEFVSSGYEAIWGQSLEAVHDRYDDGFFGTLHPDDVEGYRRALDGIIDDAERNCADERYTETYRIERPSGERRWVQSDFYPTTWDDETPRIVIVSRDITERRERDRTVESFHDATAELTTADTVRTASQIAVEAGAEVLGLPATAVYHYDDETATLEPTAAGPAMPAPDDLPALTADHTPAWDTFVGEQLQRVDIEDTPPLAVGTGTEALLVPLGGNGILGVWTADGQVDTDAASILAATLEASLNRLRGERQLQSRREELQAQTERARRLDAVAELTQRVEAAITTNSSRRGVQEAVCSELVDVEPFAAAFIAVAEVGTDRLTPRAVAGIDRDHVEQTLQRTDGPDEHPAIAAWQRGESRVVNDLVGAGRHSDWRQRLLRDGVGAVCAVPLTYNDMTHGVLTVVANDPDEFGDRAVDVLSQLGTSIGYAITAVERQRALESDETLELEFEGHHADIQFAQLARELDCRVRHERTVRRKDGSVRVFYTVLEDSAGTAPARILPGDVTVVSRQDGETLIERQGSSWFGSLISEYGGVLRRGYATAAGVTLVVELPQETNTRTIVERLRAAYPSLELTAQRQHHDTESTTGEVLGRLQQRLSDRQYEALETGYAMGYFDWPRESSGEDVADRLGITQPTVNKHIRLGERKVFDLLFGSGSVVSTDDN